jgi:hypothetical protein
MSATVVDTNVILVANGAHAAVSGECIASCALALQKLMNNGVVVIDNGYLILNEYQNKTSPRKGKGAGDVFLKWLLNGINSRTCQATNLTNSSGFDVSYTSS